jgi:hypothetical protein
MNAHTRLSHEISYSLFNTLQNPNQVGACQDIHALVHRRVLHVKGFSCSDFLVATCTRRSAL